MEATYKKNSYYNNVNTSVNTCMMSKLIMLCLSLLSAYSNGFSISNNLPHMKPHHSSLLIPVGSGPISSPSSSLFPHSSSSSCNGVSSISCYYKTKKKYSLFSSTKDKIDTTNIDTNTEDIDNTNYTSLSTSHNPSNNSIHSIQQERQQKQGANNTRPKKRYIPKRIMDIYVSYVSRLWKETNKTSREKIANQKAYYAIQNIQHLLQDGEEYVNIMNQKDDDTLDDIEKKIVARNDLLNACNVMLEILGSGSSVAEKNSDDDEVSIETSNETRTTTLKEVITVEEEKGQGVKKKKSRSVLFGATMGAIVACWVFSGNFLFTALFTLMTILGQLEYYRMVMRVGIYPARKISVVGACAMFITALYAPVLHQICLPFFATYAMIWFLTMRRKVSTISEIATTFTGMFYLGYIPSFWVRIRLIEATVGQPATLIRPIAAPILDTIKNFGKSTFPSLSRFIHSPVTAGSVFIFWTWISIAFSDVGAYFLGRKYGKTKLGSIFPAAGEASPNKTVEGYLGGSLVCAAFATTGALIMQWPYWYVTGPIHGLILAFLGLVGDLTASMLKRDSGLKDFGDLLPEHGGIMDRVDSFVFTAPYSWLVCQFIIPVLRARSRLAVP